MANLSAPPHNLNEEQQAPLNDGTHLSCHRNWLDSLGNIDNLVFIGFTRTGAEKILQDFNHQNPGNLLNCIFGHLEALELHVDKTLPLRDQMEKFGVSKSFADSILDPRFQDLFRTQDLLYWIEDRVNINYNTLLTRAGLLKLKHLAEAGAAEGAGLEEHGEKENPEAQSTRSTISSRRICFQCSGRIQRGN
jgi:hypothetical protein